MLGDLREVKGTTGGNHVVAERHEGQLDGHAARGENDVFCGDGRRVIAFADAHGLGVLELGPAVDDLDAGLAEQGLDALVEAVDDAVLPFDHTGHADLSGRGEADALVAAFLGELRQLVNGLGDVDHRLGGDAAADEAGATGTLAFDDDGVEAELTGADGGDVATWASANDEDLTGTLLHLIHLT